MAWCSRMIWWHLDFCIPGDIRLIVDCIYSFPRRIPATAPLLDSVKHQEVRIIILERICAGRWISWQNLALCWCLPWWRHLFCLDCCWKRSWFLHRHRLWSILTRSCACPIPTRGYWQVSSWYASRNHRSLGITCRYPHDPWLGCTGLYGTSWNSRSRCGWGTFMERSWRSQYQ